MLTKLVFLFRKLFSLQRTNALCIGIEHSKFAGELPGAINGARSIFSKIKARCNYAKLLLDSEATKFNVLYELQKVCNSDLAIITFNCHGGQQSGNETDGKNEFLGLYDRPLVDNEIWNIISKAKGRVFIVFDCCHSETMFRNIDIRAANPDLLVWSACGDNELSYGFGNNGGILTHVLIKKIRWYRTYNMIWKMLAKNRQISKYETIKQTMLLGKNSKFNKQFFLS